MKPALFASPAKVVAHWMTCCACVRVVCARACVFQRSLCCLLLTDTDMAPLWARCAGPPIGLSPANIFALEYTLCLRERLEMRRRVVVVQCSAPFRAMARPMMRPRLCARGKPRPTFGYAWPTPANTTRHGVFMRVCHLIVLFSSLCGVGPHAPCRSWTALCVATTATTPKRR